MMPMRDPVTGRFVKRTQAVAPATVQTTKMVESPARFDTRMKKSVGCDKKTAKAARRNSKCVVTKFA